MQFPATPNQLRDLNVFYTLTDSQGVVQMIDVCKLDELMSLKNARKKRNFSQVFPPDLTMTITAQVYGTEQQCREAEMNYLRNSTVVWPALCGFCVCNETNEQFLSVTDAAKAHGLSGSALYNHLNKRPGYASVRGRTYRKGIL